MESRCRRFYSGPLIGSLKENPRSADQVYKELQRYQAPGIVRCGKSLGQLVDQRIGRNGSGSTDSGRWLHVRCTPNRVDWGRHPSRRDVPKGDMSRIARAMSGSESLKTL